VPGEPALDTHALLWWLADDRQLGDEARRAIAEPANAVCISAVSIWEARIKQAIGKLELPDDFATVLSEQAFLELPVTVEHAHALAELPMHHRDPFDRMLIAQATVEGLVLATRDGAFDAYDVELLQL
jgi:PIN domain nuclease of toxin-antitoxin system